jgi:DNA-binding transcriptional ArsR family regulator
VTDSTDALTSMRAWAHPVRLRILSLLTASAMSAAEVARELDLTHANASYHLRHLSAAGLLVVESTEQIRGGVAKRYRYRPELEPTTAGASTPAATFRALAEELVRRGLQARAGRQVVSDAELWVPPADWDAARTAVYQAMQRLHEAAVAAETPGALRTSSTVAMFLLDQDSHDGGR